MNESNFGEVLFLQDFSCFGGGCALVCTAVFKTVVGG